MKLVKKELSYKGTRLKVLTDEEEYVKIATDELLKQRNLLENYIEENPKFASALKPIDISKNEPMNNINAR